MANRNDMTGETTALVGGLLVIQSTGKVVVESGATVAGLAAYTVQTGIADLTDNGGGAAADGTIAVVTNPTLDDWDGATVFPSAAQATAINAAITALKAAVKELSTKTNAILASLRLGGALEP